MMDFIIYVWHSFAYGMRMSLIIMACFYAIIIGAALICEFIDYIRSHYQIVRR